jgi:hypothetical protein
VIGYGERAGVHTGFRTIIVLYIGSLPHGHMIPLWKGKNPIYFGVITIIPFDNLYRQAYFVMHTFLVFISDEYECVISDFTSNVPCIYFFLFQMTMSVSSVILHQMYLVSILQ